MEWVCEIIASLTTIKRKSAKPPHVIMAVNGVAEWGVVTAIALPHYLYAVIWFFPDAWQRLCGKHAVAHFETAAWILKGVPLGALCQWLKEKHRASHPSGLQFASVGAYAVSSPGWPPSLAVISPPLALLALVCIAAGQVGRNTCTSVYTRIRSQTQALNVGIYNAIGHAGVYYGFKLGHRVPWHTGFPFNVVAHPQCARGGVPSVYDSPSPCTDVGSVLTVWGAALPLLSQLPCLAVLAAFWTGLYILTAVHEQFF